MAKMNVDDISFYEWLNKVKDAAKGVADPTLLSNARRRKERELAELTTPANCLYMVGFILRWLPEDEYKKKQVRHTE